jgi:NADH:ubiquinone oxidoreductase subunit 4 (subunit M)
MPANHRHFLELPNGMKLEVRGLQARNALLAEQLVVLVVIKGADPATVYNLSAKAAKQLLGVPATKP